MYVLSPMFVFFPKPAFGGGLRAVARRKCSRSYLHLTRWGETGMEQGGLCTTNLVSWILEPSVRLVGRGAGTQTLRQSLADDHNLLG